jgi:hypothetical protein
MSEGLDGQREIETWEEFKKTRIRNRGEKIPVTLMYEGIERSVKALCYLLTGEDALLLKCFCLRNAESRTPPVVSVVREGFYVFLAETEGEGEPFFLGGRPYLWGSRPGRRVTPDMGFSAIREHWEHVVYAGRHLFRKILLAGPRELPMGDISITVSEGLCYEPSLYEVNVMLAALYPIPDLEGSFIRETMYETAEYSLYAEAYHGKIADQIGEQWAGPMRVVADGAGLFKSRFGDRVESSDIQIHPWVHRGVQQMAITEALRETRPDELQVFCYCNAFLTEEDYAMVRHPFIFIDKYRPKIQGDYSNDYVTSSLPMVVGAGELHRTRNPPFSENMLRLGKVRFLSDHLSSQYARRLGMIGDGPLVTQTWEEMIENPDDYAAMVGMVPIFENYNPRRPILYSRVIYRTNEDNLPKGASVFITSNWKYFFFSDPRDFDYPSLGRVLPFPGVSGSLYVGRPYSDLEEEYGEKIAAWLAKTFEREFIYAGHMFEDYRQAKELWEYRTVMYKGVKLEPNVAQPLLARNQIVKRGKLYFKTDGTTRRPQFVESIGVEPIKVVRRLLPFKEQRVASLMRDEYGPGKWYREFWRVSVVMTHVRSGKKKSYQWDDPVDAGSHIIHSIPDVTVFFERRMKFSEWLTVQGVEIGRPNG